MHLADLGHLLSPGREQQRLDGVPLLVVLGVSDDADDLPVGRIVRFPDALAERVLAREILPGEGLIDDRDAEARARRPAR